LYPIFIEMYMTTYKPFHIVRPLVVMLEVNISEEQYPSCSALKIVVVVQTPQPPQKINIKKIDFFFLIHSDN
jgi:hypothetical protein